MAAEALLTIGVYGFTEDGFFSALRAHEVDCFCDVRARRGLRGSQYAFANSKRLQARLEDMGIRYVHAKDLAPSKDVRLAQQEQDKRLGVAKRDRSELGQAFRERYVQECIQGLDARQLLDSLVRSARRPVFFCVEREPKACHRSLLVEAISKQTGLPVEHVMP